MFDNCDPYTNGELDYFHSIEPECKVIFDVGCRDDSIFTEFNGVVHYFDPVKKHVHALKDRPNRNARSFFNVLALGDKPEFCSYYSDAESFINRNHSQNMREYFITTGQLYMEKNGITSIDFLKIDTEGYELRVVKGFGDLIRRVHRIQFEYGGTYQDAHLKLGDVVEYLRDRGFTNFAYLNGSLPPSPVDNFLDHYTYCNIVCEQEGFRNCM